MPSEVSFDAAFAAAGGVRRTGQVEYPIDHEKVRRMAQLQEDVLRLQFPDEKFDQEDEEQLAALSLDDPQQAWLRYRHLTGMRFAWDRQYTKGHSTKAEALEASFQLRTRQSVRVIIAGRNVDVTGRSRNAMIALARHEITRRQTASELDEIAAVYAEVEAELSGRWRGRGPLRRRLRKLAELHRRGYHVLRLHSRWIYAHALTPSGAPASSAAEAPSWWNEISSADETLLLDALMEAGPRRYERLGPEPPPDPAADDWKQVEDFGYDSLWASAERGVPLPPASIDDQDYYRLRAWLRNSAHPRKRKTEAA